MRNFAVFMTLTVVALAAAPAANAHTKLTGSTPAANQTVATAPTKLELSFSTDVSESLQDVSVVDARGEDIAGTAQSHGTTVTVALSTGAAGQHTVSWRTLGADGHPIKGSFIYTVRTPATATTPDNETAAANSTPPSAEARQATHPVTNEYPITALERVGAVARAAYYLSLLTLVGGAIFASMIARGWRPRYFRRTAWIVVAASLTTFVTNLALAGEYSVWGIVNPWNFVPYAATPTGRVALASALGALLLLRGYEQLREASRSGDQGARTRFALLAIIVGVIPVFGGHAWASQLPALRVPADMLHVLAASIWFGGIVQLKGVAGADFAKHPAVYPAVRRFAQLAFASVVVLVVTGAIAAWLEIGLDVGELVGSTYGRLVLVKVALLALTIPLAKINQERNLPALIEQTRRASANLRRYVFFEIALVAVIVLVTSWLVYETPPRHAKMGHDLHSSS